jgi:gliding motility-associated-like protein
VPWNNTNTTHKVYRESRRTRGVFEEIATVQVGAETTFQYTDTGNGIALDEDSSYCYYVETYGNYGNPKIPSPLVNKSQIACAAPLDTLRPCPPLLAIDLLDCSLYETTPSAFCSVTSFTNKLTWEPAAVSAGCDEDVVSYRLYYKRYEEDTDFTLIATIAVPLQQYLHENLSSFAGCYYITALDEDGQESAPSNTVCKDNCPYYELPNVITPNGDEKNDLFKPFDCPRFVESVKVDVHNRWGRPVFTSEGSIYINWDGTLKGVEASSQPNTSNQQVSAGVYYYLAEVRFSRLRRKDEKVQIKGWLHILK